MGITNINMWLAVQYWEMYYNDEEVESEEKEKCQKKKVTFEDENEVQNILIEVDIFDEKKREEKDNVGRKKKTKSDMKL